MVSSSSRSIFLLEWDPEYVIGVDMTLVSNSLQRVKKIAEKNQIQGTIQNYSTIGVWKTSLFLLKNINLIASWLVDKCMLKSLNIFWQGNIQIHWKINEHCLNKSTWYITECYFNTNKLEDATYEFWIRKHTASRSTKQFIQQDNRSKVW